LVSPHISFVFAGLKVIVSALHDIDGVFHKSVTIAITECTNFPKI